MEEKYNGESKVRKNLKDRMESKENIFIPYIMAGDGGLGILEERISFLEECGASAIEVGIPFSDPVADGPVIQDAGIRALKNDTTLSGVIETLQSFKDSRSIPIIMMTYLNPVYAYGLDRFISDCAAADVDGIIIPDMPMEEENILAESLSEHGIAFIRLAAMTSPLNRLTALAQRSEGFLYAVAVNGTTGVRTSHDERVKAYLSNLKEHSHVPVLAGFGVSNSGQAHALSNHCDGVIVGSKIVELLHEGKDEEVKAFIQESIKLEIPS